MVWEKIEGMTFEPTFIGAVGTEIEIPSDIQSNATSCPHEDEYLCADAERPRYTGFFEIDGMYVDVTDGNETIHYLPHQHNVRNLFFEELENIEGQERILEDALLSGAKVYSGTFVHDHREQIAVVDKEGDISLYVRKLDNSFKNADIYDDVESFLFHKSHRSRGIIEVERLHERADEAFAYFAAGVVYGLVLAHQYKQNINSRTRGMAETQFQDYNVATLRRSFSQAFYAHYDLNRLTHEFVNIESDSYCDIIMDREIPRPDIDDEHYDDYRKEYSYCEKKTEASKNYSYWSDRFEQESQASICPLIADAKDYVESFSVKFTLGEIDQREMARYAHNRHMSLGKTYITNLIGEKPSSDDEFSFSVVGERIF